MISRFQIIHLYCSVLPLRPRSRGTIRTHSFNAETPHYSSWSRCILKTCLRSWFFVVLFVHVELQSRVYYIKISVWWSDTDPDMTRWDYYPGINLGLPYGYNKMVKKIFLEKYGMPYTVKRTFLSRLWIWWNKWFSRNWKR